MTDFVVYEDTHIVDYLKSIDGGETNVKPAPLHLGIHHSNMVPKTSAVSQLSESLYRYWRQSLFHDTFSVSLPIMEESAFEEKFKYLIVTSPLLNDTLSTHPKQQQQRSKSTPTTCPPFHSAAAHTRSTRIGTMATLSALLVALGLERIIPFQQQHRPQETTTLVLKGTPTPTITMALTSGVSLYFIYRHLRRSSIRKLYQCALTQLQEFLDQSQLLDSKVHRALLAIQEIELVSYGYRLSTPLSPLSRIEQSSKSKRCARLRTELSGLLRHAFIVYEETIIDMTDRVNKSTLSRLFDMYNIHSIASLSAVSTTPTPTTTKHMNDDTMDDDEGITLDYLKTLAQLMHLKRRECLLQFLALSVMTGNHDSMRKGYESGWKNVNTILVTLGNETKGFVKTVKDAMESEFCKSSTLDLDNHETSSSLSTNTDTRHFIHRLSTLDQHLRTMEARVYLCHDELQRRQRTLSLNRNNTNKDRPHLIELEQQQQSLKKEYLAMEKDIQQLMDEWETGRNALDTLLTPLPPPMIDTLSSTTDIIPSPLPSPTMTPTTASHIDDDDDNDDDDDHHHHHHPFVVTSDESSDPFDLPLPSKASVYESICNVHDPPSPHGPNNPLDKKKSRFERITEMKLKREQEAKEKASRADNQTMVHELKDVLVRRTLELDLANNDDQST